MQKIFSFLLVIILCSNVFAKTNYESKTFERDENKILEFDKFYLAHYFIFDVLLALNIYDKLNLEDKKNIINDLHKHLSNSYQKEITLTSIKPINLIIFMKPFKVGNDMSIFMLTNYDVETKKFVPNKSKDTVYAKQYFICETKLIPRKDFQNRNKSKSIINNYIKEKDYNSLANFLLYDDSLDNDSKIINYLEEGLKSNPPLIDKTYINLTIMEYSLLIKNYKKYDETYTIISNDMKNSKNKKEQTLIKQELEIMNDLRYILE